MLDHSTSLNPQNHYASNDTGHGAVLVQLQEAYSSGTGDQVRAMLMPDEARHLAQLLTDAAVRAEADR